MVDIDWYVDPQDIRALRDFVNAHRHNPFVKRRRRRNLQGDRKPSTPANVWHALVTCLVTSQQRSGPNSRAYAFIKKRPFPVGLSRVKTVNDPARLIGNQLRRHKGIRRWKNISSELSENLQWFSGSRWRDLKKHLSEVEYGRGYYSERKAANWLAQEIKGLGPKQSRNLLQLLGLSRYEIPLDSRVMKWFNDFGFPVRLTSKALADPEYYDFVSDGVRTLCKAGRVYPCILDAAIFASFDKDQWDEVFW